MHGAQHFANLDFKNSVETGGLRQCGGGRGLRLSDGVEEVEVSACYAAPPGGGTGNKRDRWASKEMARKTRVSLILAPTPRTVTSVPYL